MFILKICNNQTIKNIFNSTKINPNLAIIRSLHALYYAKYVIKGRFELGESIIATDDYCAFNYAFDVLKSPFPLGEKAITKSKYYSYLYTHFVLKQNFYIDSELICEYNKNNISW